jgi:hypothetical protein
MPDSTRAAVSQLPLPRVAGRRGLFYQAYAAMLLLAVLAGFSHTFYLRPWFTDTALALALSLHGIALTAWFALFLAQTLLVRGGRIAVHRLLGATSVVVVAAVVATCLVVVFDIVHSWRAAGADVEGNRQLLSMIVWGNLGAVLAYVVFYVRGVLKRRDATAHKRLMLLASLSIISPAVSRIALMPLFAGMDLVLSTVLGVVALLAVLPAYDLIALRRVHRETQWGVPFVLLALFGTVFAVPGTALDTWLMDRIW